MAKASLTKQTMITASKPNFQQSMVNIRQISTILLHQRWLIFGISCIVISVTSLGAVVTKPKYQSSMQIMVSSHLDESLRSGKISEEGNSELNRHDILSADYTTQMRLLVSYKLVQKAVNLLHRDYPDLTIDEIKGSGENVGKSALEINSLENISLSNHVSSQVFIVSFKDRDPVKTKRVLQALQKVYQDYNIEQKEQRLNQGLAFVNARLPKVQNELKAAEKKLEIFRKKHNLVDPAVQSRILLESLADVQKQLQNTRIQLQDVQTRYNNLQQAIAISSQNAQLANRLIQSNRYQSLLTELKNTEKALAQERLRYRDNYPTVVKLKQQYQVQLSLLQQEIKSQENNNTNNLEALRGIEPSLLNELNQLQTIAQGLAINESNLVKAETQIHSQLNTYPVIIAQYNRLVGDIQTHRKTLEQLLQVQQTLGMKITQNGFDWQILEEPNLGIYIGHRRWLMILTGLVLGPIVGAIAALVPAFWKNAIFSTQVLQGFKNLHLLGAVPKLQRYSFKEKIMRKLGKWGNDQLSDQEFNSQLPIHETLDMIYQNIQIFQNHADVKSIMLTSALKGEGKTTITLGLGASAAHLHQRVLIIDANLREPSLHKILELPNDWGLSLLLVDDFSSQLYNYVQPIHPSIDILTAGPIPEDTANLLSYGRLTELIKSFAELYDLILIDAPSVLNTVDSRLMALSCDGTILVSQMGKIKTNHLVEATEILNQLNLIGVVANNVVDSPKITPSVERTGKVRFSGFGTLGGYK